MKIILLVSLYFFGWFGTLLIIKLLLLEEYNIKFYNFSAAIVGALVVAKAVLILEHVPIGLKNKPEIVNILFRTLLYLAGVTFILILEHAIESRHENGGFFNALKYLTNSADKYHVLVNVISVFWALFYYNLWSVISGRFEGHSLWRVLFSSTKKQ